MARRRRIRWDRVFITAALFIGLIILLGSCAQKCSGRSSKEESSTGSPLEPLGSDSSRAGSAESTGINSGGSGDEPAQTQTAPVALPADYTRKTVTANEMYKGSLVLVNDDNPNHLSREELDLLQIYYAPDRPDCYVLSYPAYTFLNRTALTRFNAMMKAYYAATSNEEIMFNYGYLETGKEKSNPESSSGLNIQLHLKLVNGSYDFISNTGKYAWIFEHMDSYGYILRYPADKSDITGVRHAHPYSAIRYVGTPHAAYIKQNNLCLEEYLDLLKNQYTFGQGMLDFAVNELQYRIYYVPASRIGDTEVPVPIKESFDISGNNVDGFIVTVQMN